MMMEYRSVAGEGAAIGARPRAGRHPPRPLAGATVWEVPEQALPRARPADPRGRVVSAAVQGVQRAAEQGRGAACSRERAEGLSSQESSWWSGRGVAVSRRRERREAAGEGGTEEAAGGSASSAPAPRVGLRQLVGRRPSRWSDIFCG